MQEQLINKISEIMTLAAKINFYVESQYEKIGFYEGRYDSLYPNVFVDYSGHTNSLYIRIYTKGWGYVRKVNPKDTDTVITEHLFLTSESGKEQLCILTQFIDILENIWFNLVNEGLEELEQEES